MKKILIAGVLLAASCGVLAKDKMTKDDAIEEICGGTAGYAEAVMRSRQNGVKLTDSINNINKNLKSSAIRDYYKAIAHEAYREPKWSTRENQENAVVEFSNKMYLACATAFQEELKNLD